MALTSMAEWIGAFLLCYIHTSTFILHVYKGYKLLIRSVTGTTELVRLCTPSVRAVMADDNDDNDDDENTLWTEVEEVERIPLMRSRCRSAGVDLDISVGTVYRVDRSLLYSTQLTEERRALEGKDCNIDTIFHAILSKKAFPHKGSPSTPAALVLKYSLYNIAASHSLAADVGALTKTKYDPTNPAHEYRLLKLWKALKPQVSLEERYTKQWQEIGFQGKDPATDFRGMGLLGLEDLLYYAVKYPESAGVTLAESKDPEYWYSFAIVGINISAFAVECLHNRSLQYFLFRYGTSLDVYHEYYAYLFASFHHLWVTRNPRPTVMDFAEVFEEFKEGMRRELLERRPVVLDEASLVLHRGAKAD